MMSDRIFVAGFVAVIIGLVWFVVSESKECEEKGGVYLYREYKCVTGIKELK
jgi:hypothetical protein